MTIHIEDRDIQHWPEWESAATSVDGIPQGVERAILYRQKASHRGIASVSNLRKLRALQVNQDFLDEIGALENLEYLELDTVTAEDLSPLTQLRRLKTIRMSNVRKAAGFDAVVDLPSLEKLFIENARNLKSLDVLSNARNLRSIGIEGSLWTPQPVASLRPLSGLPALEALFMTAVTLEDTSLSYLATCPRLRILECARFAPEAEFIRLRELMPRLACDWCDKYQP